MTTETDITYNVRFRRDVLGWAYAELTASDGGSAIVWCPIPGGRPVFQFNLEDRFHTPVSDAPTCDTFTEFENFVRDRWEVA